jgi:hypothetical protein
LEKERIRSQDYLFEIYKLKAQMSMQEKKIEEMASNNAA